MRTCKSGVQSMARAKRDTCRVCGCYISLADWAAEQGLDPKTIDPICEECGAIADTATRVQERYADQPWLQSVGVGRDEVVVYASRYVSRARRIVAQDDWDVPVVVRNGGKIRPA